MVEATPSATAHSEHLSSLRCTEVRWPDVSCQLASADFEVALQQASG